LAFVTGEVICIGLVDGEVIVGELGVGKARLERGSRELDGVRRDGAREGDL
jgi:hypothetical protein